jgi:hypothetical protein
MTPEQAHEVLSRNCLTNVGRFYGASSHLPLGAGLIYSDVRSPLYDADSQVFMTVESTAYVMTHECDVDGENDRAFSDHLLICPLITLPALIAEFKAAYPNDEKLKNFLEATAKRQINRLVYLPPGPKELKYGAFAYLNALCSTHVDALKNMKPFAAVSGYGLEEIDRALERHLMRPKSEALSFMPEASLSQQ